MKWKQELLKERKALEHLALSASKGKLSNLRQLFREEDYPFALETLKGIFDHYPQSGLVHMLPAWSVLCKAIEHLETERSNHG